MICFKPVTIEDKNLFDTYLLNDIGVISDKSFFNIFCWQGFYDTMWSELENCLVIRFKINGFARLGYMVFGNNCQEIPHAIILKLNNDALSFGQPLILTCLTEDNVKFLKSQTFVNFIFEESRNSADYIYYRTDLVNLEGRKYAAKRNHIKQFKTQYKYEYKPLTKDGFKECVKWNKKWNEKNEIISSTLVAESNAIEMAYNNFESLNLIGGILYVDDCIIAFTYGSPLNNSTVCVHVEKANKNYVGVYAMINNLFAKNLPSPYQYINREEDLGDMGLRKSKLSYHPIFVKNKVLGMMLNDDLYQIKKIWLKCFNDPESYFDAFLVRFYSPEYMITYKVNNKIVSVSYVVPCTGVMGNAAYLFGLATLPEHRGKGYASTVVREILELCKKKNFDVVIQIPAKESLKNFYSKLGFIDANIHLSFTSDFDLGTGNSNEDNAMIAFLKDQNTNHYPAELVCKPYDEI